jgi:release factor glutamine methyltransferase
MTIDGLLRLALIDGLDARILMAHALQCSRVQLVIRSQDILSADEVSKISALFIRRMEGEPVAYLTGEREFFGLKFHVTPDVLIPRPETELLVELAAEKLPQHGRALDLGTGSGAIAVSLAHLRRDAALTATDISTAALQIAQKNAATHCVAVRFMHSDWYAAVAGDFDLIVSNPPYIVAGNVHLTQGDLRFEPVDALTDHMNGLTALAAIIEGAPKHLKPGCWLLMEHGYDQPDAVCNLLRKAGWLEVQSWPDLAGILRVSGARLPDK